MDPLSPRARTILADYREETTLSDADTTRLLSRIDQQLITGGAAGSEIAADVLQRMAARRSWLGTSKVLVGGLLAASVVMAVALHANEPTRDAPLVRAAVQPIEPARVVVPEETRKQLAVDAPQPVSKLSGRRSIARAAPGIDAEIELLKSAQRALQAGEAGRALQIARAHERRFPSGQLLQAREVVAIDAQCRLGDHDRASQRAKRFIERWPSSPFRTRVERMCIETKPLERQHSPNGGVAR